MTRSAARKNPGLPRPAYPTAWTWHAHGRLAGLDLAREGLFLVCWDDARHVYRVGLDGRTHVERPMDEQVVAVTVADTGKRVLVATSDGRLHWLDDELGIVHDFESKLIPIAVAVDPFGDYVAVAGEGNRMIVADRTGKLITAIATPQLVRHLAFVPESGQLLAASREGVLCSYDLRGNLLWKETFLSTVGKMVTDASGDVILLASYSYGILRFDAKGRHVGSYQFAHAPHQVGMDIDATRLVAASTDGWLTALDGEGVVLADSSIGEQPAQMVMDALGQYVILGFDSGDVRLIPWEEIGRPATMAETEMDLATAIQTGYSMGTDPNQPDWQTLVAGSLAEGASAVLEPIGETPAVALYTNRKTVRIYDAEGNLHHESVRVEGVGRAMRSNEHWLLAASDRRLLAYDPATGQSQLAAMDVYEISHLFPLATAGQAIIIESCDQISRLHWLDEIVWRHLLPVRVASAAMDRAGNVGLVLDDHQFIVVNPDGKAIGRFRTPKPAPLMVADRPGGWVTASIEEQRIRGHHLNGDEAWTDNLPWNPWSIQSVGKSIVVNTSDGRSRLYSATGDLLVDSDETREGAQYVLVDGQAHRLHRAGGVVTLSRFDGKLAWRRKIDGAIGAVTANSTAVWMVVDRSLRRYSLPRSAKSSPFSEESTN